jgi:hypothetical protein
VKRRADLDGDAGDVSGPKLKKPRTALPPPREMSKRFAINRSISRLSSNFCSM